MKSRTTRSLLWTITLFFTSLITLAQVTNGNDNGPGSLRQAVIDANANAGPDFINIDPGLTISLTSGTINITDTVFIFGNNSTIDGSSNTDRAFTAIGTSGISETVSFDNLNFNNNSAIGDGGAIKASDMSVFINSGVYSNNEATGMPASGGAVYIEGAENLDIIDAEFTANTATRAGGAIETQIIGIGFITISGTTFTNNTASGAPGNGGALHITGNTDASISGGSADGNIAANEGGAFWNGSGVMTISNTVIQNNIAQGDDADSGGGGLFNEGGVLTLDPTTIVSGNAATGISGSGGGILTNNGSLNIDGVTISGNTANRAGGGIEVIAIAGDTYTFTNVTLEGNMIGTAAPGNGGAYHISGAGNSTFIGCTIINNTAVEGGGLWNFGGGIMTVTGSTIDSNIATGDLATKGGGGIFNNGGTLLVDGLSQIVNNMASGTSGSGGGILSNAGDVTILGAGTAILANTANRAGGGIEIIDGSLTTNDIDWNDNNAGVSPAVAAPGNGGALHVSGVAVIEINGGNINNNSAALEGGGVWNQAGSTMTLENSNMMNNVASGSAADDGGGAVFNNGGTLNMINGTFLDNIADGASGSGGAVLSTGGAVTINTSVITNNSSNRAGGGIEIAAGTLVTTDITLSNNITNTAPGNGGGLHVGGGANSTITGGTVDGNTAGSEGGGLWNSTGIMTVNGVTITNNTASGAMAENGGGGIYNDGGTLNVDAATFIDGNIADGAAGSGGGILTNNGLLNIDGVTISNNIANRAGGGIEVRSLEGDTYTFTDVTLDGNSIGVAAPGNGGGYHISGAGNSTFIDCTITDNTAVEGGGLWNFAGGTMTVSNLNIQNNIATGDLATKGGGGIFNSGGTLLVDNSTSFTNNQATGTSGSGGALFSTEGEVTILDAVFEINAANRAGGAIELIDGALTISETLFYQNDVNGSAGTPAPGNGGAIHITGIAATDILASEFIDNVAAAEGGALWNQTGSTMNVIMSRLAGNSVSGMAEGNGGGAIYVNGGDFNLESSTVNQNNSSSRGGAIVSDSGITTIMRSTISGNTALGNGGAIFTNAETNINAVTIAMNNSDAEGGGIFGNAITTLKNTIVAQNTAVNGNDVAGLNVMSNDYNLIGTDDLNVFSEMTNDIEEQDAMLGPLQSNGGATETHELLTGSLAYNAGDPTDLFSDQIAQDVFDGIRDIGAFESQTVLLAVATVSASESGIVIFPNPSRGQATIDIPATFGSNLEVNVIEAASGKRITTFNANIGANDLDFNNLSVGVYIVTVTSNDVSSVHRVIVSR